MTSRQAVTENELERRWAQYVYRSEDVTLAQIVRCSRMMGYPFFAFATRREELIDEVREDLRRTRLGRVLLWAFDR